MERTPVRVTCAAALVVFAFVLPALGQVDSALDTIKERALESVRTLPNFTCTSLIERSSRRSVRKPLENVDRIRLEIGYIGGRELYGWPQGGAIAEADLRRLVEGTITNGDFALLTRAVFAGPGVTFKPVQRKEAAGRVAWSGAFKAAREGSEWVLATPDRSVPVPYSGTFTADAESLRLLSLEMTADFIPRDFGYRRVSRRLEFQPVRIGSEDVLLPARAQFVTLDMRGEETQNETRFTDCHQYAAESVLRFEAEEPEVQQPTAAPIRAGGLPEEFTVGLELETPVDSDTSAIGDPVRFAVKGNVSGPAGVVVPKGAALIGRVQELTVRDGHRYAEFAFRYFEFGGKQVPLSGRENQTIIATRKITGSQATGPGNWSPQTPTVESFESSMIRGSGRRLVLERGYALRLRSKEKGQ